MNTQATMLVQSLGWALLHSLWQVLLIYCCLRIVLKVSGNVTARLKYHLSVAALAGSFVWFANTVYAQWQRLQAVTIHVTQSGADPAATKTYSLTTLPSSTYNTAVFNNIVKGIEPHFPLLVSLYVAGILFLLVRLAVNLLQIRGLGMKGLVQADAYWNEWMQQWQNNLDISRKVKLYLSDRINVPMTIGAMKPIILMPIATMSSLSSDQVEAILLHELAHIKRHDYLLNILQTIVETILFFNPFVWLISKIIRKEREHCCDDVVLGHLNLPLPYAKALATLESYRLNNTLAVAARGENKHQLLNRIKRIMEMKRKPVNYTQVGIAALLIIALLVSVAWFSPTLAQTKKVTTKDKKGNKTTVTSSNKTNKKGTVITRSVVIETKDEDSDGVHPNDVGNAEHVDKMVKEAMADVDWNGISKNVQVAIGDVDWDKIGKDVHVAIAGVDWDKMGNEVAVAVNGVDWNEMSKEMRKAGKELECVDWNDIQVKIDKAMNDPDLKRKIDIELENARNAHGTARVRVIDARKEMEQARAEMEEARQDMERDRKKMHRNSRSKSYSYSYNSGDYDEMLDRMESDGLLDRDKSFSVKKEDGELFINGKKQSASVLEKYDQYLGDADQVNIKGSKGNLNVNVNTNR